jgi:hypothetical protein
VEHLFERNFIHPIAFITGIFLLQKLLKKENEKISTEMFLRFLLGSLILASKMYEDDYIRTVDYLEGLELNIFGIEVKDLKEMEIEVWELLEYNVCVNEKEVESYLLQLENCGDLVDKISEKCQWYILN